MFFYTKCTCKHSKKRLINESVFILLYVDSHKGNPPPITLVDMFSWKIKYLNKI